MLEHLNGVLGVVVAVEIDELLRDGDEGVFIFVGSLAYWAVIWLEAGKFDEV
jgi:hypothetical protein